MRAVGTLTIEDGKLVVTAIRVGHLQKFGDAAH